MGVGAESPKDAVGIRGKIEDNTTHAWPLAWMGAVATVASPRSFADDIDGDDGASGRGKDVCRVGFPPRRGAVVVGGGGVDPITPY